MVVYMQVVVHGMNANEEKVDQVNGKRAVCIVPDERIEKGHLKCFYLMAKVGDQQDVTCENRPPRTLERFQALKLLLISHLLTHKLVS